MEIGLLSVARLASGIYDVNTGKELDLLADGMIEASSIVFSPDEKC